MWRRSAAIAFVVPQTITQFVVDSMQQIDRNMTQVEGPQLNSLKVINLSSIACEIWESAGLGDSETLHLSARRCYSSCSLYLLFLYFLYEVYKYISLFVILRTLYCFIMSLGVFIVSLYVDVSFPILFPSPIQVSFPIPIEFLRVLRNLCDFWAAIYAGSSKT